LDSSLIVGLLAAAGQHGLATFSVGFEAAGGEQGDEFIYSDLVAHTFATDHHRIAVSEDQLLAALPDAIAAMSEPMTSHDVVGFYLLSQAVTANHKVVPSGQGADDVFAGYHWYPPMTAVDASVETYIRRFFDRDHARMQEVVAPDYQLQEDASRAFVEQHFARPGADTAADRALRLDTTIMLVDDPVKRVDNMTMAWGLEARVPFLDHELVELAASCPPELKVADGGKGVLKRAARGVIPDAVIDRSKGSFPVPALTTLEGPYLRLMIDALRAPEAKERGLFRAEYVERLIAAPNAELTPLRGNKLWQLGVLELWLQTHGIQA
jgi:asparagine synthase (glutamine-hydrolysing)